MSLIKPVKGNFPISQRFGEHSEWYRKFNLLAHNGIDIACPIGTPLIAPIEGVVVEVDYEPEGYGWYIKVENAEEGALTAHLSRVDVQIGFVVEQGQPIGLSGNTGNSTGPHVHLGYYRIPRHRNNGYNGYLDPTPYFLAIGGQMEITPPINTYGLDDTNLQSKQIVYDTWKKVADGLMVDKIKYDEILTQNTNLQADLQGLQVKFEDKFKILGQIEDMGIKTIDDLKLITEPYLEMDKAGFPTLQAIKDHVASLELQVKNLSDALKAGTGDKQRIIELQEQINKLNTEYAAYDKTTLLNQVLAFLTRVLQTLRVKKVSTTISTDLEPVPAPEAAQVKSIWDAFNSGMGINK